MKRKMAWLGVSWLIVTALVLASCGPTVPEVVEEEEEREVFLVTAEEVLILSIGQTALIKAGEIPSLSRGQQGQIAELEVTVSDAYITDSYEYYAEYAAKMLTKEASPGMTFLIAYAKIKNMGKEQEPYQGAKRMHTVDSDGNVYEVGVYYGGGELLGGLFPMQGEEVKGWVLFNIPKGASGVKIFYQFKFPEVKLIEWEIE